MGDGPGGPPDRPQTTRRPPSHRPAPHRPLLDHFQGDGGTVWWCGSPQASHRKSAVFRHFFCESRSAPSATPTLSQGRDRPGNVAILRVSILAGGTENWYGGEVGDDPLSGRPRGRVPNQGVPEPLNPVDGFPGPAALGRDQKGQRPFDLVRLLYNRSKRPALDITPASFFRART